MSANTHTIRRVNASDLNDLLWLMRGYCDFYKASPTDVDLIAPARALLGDPGRERVQLIARDADGRAVGLATVYWSWSTTSACRIGPDQPRSRRRLTAAPIRRRADGVVGV